MTKYTFLFFTLFLVYCYRLLKCEINASIHKTFYTPSISKITTISKLENYIDENYDEAAKIQLKQAILRKVKQQIPNETKEKGHLDELLCSLHNKFLHLKLKLAF